MHAHPTNIEKQQRIKVAQGDENAFAQLFNTYYNHLGDFIMRIAESQPLTQEIAGEILYN